MCVESFARWHKRNYKTIRKKYDVSYSISFYGDDNPFLMGLRSYSPCNGNATKVLKIIVKAAKRHKVQVQLEAQSMSIGDECYSRYDDTFKEMEYVYWRALLMYQRVGFRPLCKEGFLQRVIKLRAVYLITPA